MRNKLKSFTLYEVVFLIPKMLDHKQLLNDLANKGADYVSYYRFYKSKYRNPLKEKCLGKVKYFVLSTNTDVEKDLHREHFGIHKIKEDFDIKFALDRIEKLKCYLGLFVRARRYKPEKDEFEDEIE